MDEKKLANIGTAAVVIIAAVVAISSALVLWPAFIRWAERNPNTNITPETLTTIGTDNDGCTIKRFKDMGAFVYYADCRTDGEHMAVTTSARGSVETRYSR